MAHVTEPSLFHFANEALYESITFDREYFRIRLTDKPKGDRTAIKRLRLLSQCPYSAEKLEKFRTMEQPSDEWLEARVDFLTSSRFAEMADEQPVPFGSALQYWRQVTGRVETPPFGPAQMRHVNHGRKYEPVARGVYERTFDVRVNEEGLCILDEAPWIYSASSDGLVNNDPQRQGIIEIKCNNVGVPRAEIPPYYIAQMMGAMAVYQAPFCDFVNYWAHDDKAEERFFFCSRLFFSDEYWRHLRLRLDYMAWCIAYDRPPLGMLDLKRDYPLPPIHSVERHFLTSPPDLDDVYLKVEETKPSI